MPSAQYVTAVELCSVDLTLQIISDPWSFLILRELWFGLKKFDEFQATLKIPRATLTNRLKSLTEANLLKRVPIKVGGKRCEYRLTEMGDDLYPVMISMMRWGDKWRKPDAGVPLKLTHRTCGKRLVADVVYDCCNTAVSPFEVTYTDGPGAKLVPITTGLPTNRVANQEKFSEPRECSVAKTLQSMGDRWSILLIRELFFGRHTFDLIQSQIGISTNILSDRIKLLISSGLIEKSSQQANRNRYEYHLTKSGLDLYPIFLALKQWGDRWLKFPKGIPLSLIHDGCEKNFSPKIVCQKCGGSISSKDVYYEYGPGWDVRQGEEVLQSKMKYFKD